MSRTLAGPGTDRFFHAPMAAGNGEKNIREHSSMDDTVGNTLIDDRITVDEAIRWIEAGEDPFCVSLNLQSPHFPYVLPGGEGRKRERPRIPFFTIPKDRLEEVRGRYGACVAYLDAQLGRLLNFLRLRGEWDRTVIVVTADHGEAWHEHGFTAHAYRLYDEVLRVPLVVRAPLLPPGVDRRPAQLIDIPPTVLQLLGLPDHRGFQGCNLLAPDFPYDRTRFLVSLTPLVNQYGVVRNGFKMIRDRDYGIEILYHLRTDPGEREDVMDRYPVVVQDLRCRLDSWILEQLDYYGRKERHLREYPPRFIP
jgi:arylsulfatase A-like enzyme